MTIPLDLHGQTQTTRDGRLRAAITAVLGVAHSRGVGAVAIEDLGFADARASGRDALGRGRRGKQRRRVISGIPTGRFRNRLVQMAHNQALWVVAVDPAYTSRWGGQYWQAPLRRRHPRRTVTRHHAASVVIGRRALGHGPGGGQASSTVTRGSPLRATAAQADPNPGACTARDHPALRPRTAQAAQTGRGNRDRPVPRRPRTVRGRSSAHDTLMPEDR
jgi:hypothetical protein